MKKLHKELDELVADYIRITGKSPENLRGVFRQAVAQGWTINLQGGMRVLEGQTKEFSYCARCGRTWDKCKGHTVDDDYGRGAFPICEDCWNAITIEERKFWMNKLIDEWNEKWVKSITELKRNNEFRTAVLKKIEEEGKKK